MESLELIVSSPVIVSGNDIKGEVFFTVNEDIPAKKLILLFTGKEKTCFRKQSRSGKYHKDYMGKAKTVRIEVVLFECSEGILHKGQQKLVFAMETPMELAGSFELDSPKAKGSIQYFLKVKIQDIHMFSLAKTKQKISIIQSLPQVNSLLTEFQTPLNACSCIYRGYCQTTIELSNAYFKPEDLIKIKITVDNSQARVDINSLECILWLVCRFISNENQIHFFRKCVYLYQYNEGIKYKDSIISPKEFLLEIPLKHPKIKLDLCPVTLGRILQCTYSLQVSIEYGNVIHEEPDMQIPICVALDEVVGDDKEDRRTIRITRESYEQ